MPDEIVRSEIDFSVNDSPQSVVAFLRRIRAIFDPDVPAWHVDLTKCNYLGPDAASILVASVFEARRLGVRCEVTLPTGNPALEAFCEYSGLRHHLTGKPLPDLDHPANVTIPIRIDHESNFSDPDPIIRLVRVFVPLLDENEDYLRICVNEVIQNVEDHAESSIAV